MYRMTLALTDNAKNAHSIYGHEDNALTMLASYEEAAPFGVNYGGANPAFFPIMAGTALF